VAGQLEQVKVWDRPLVFDYGGRGGERIEWLGVGAGTVVGGEGRRGVGDSLGG
jgi:hypothetical protein